MGSYSLSQSSTSAQDKRQVTSENAIGLSLDGSGNFINTGAYNPTSVTGSTFNTTDGGIIKEAFNFSNQTLSSVLALAVNRDKIATASAAAVTDSAIAGIAAIGSTTAEASAKNNKILIIGAAIVAAVWFWGRK